MPTPAPSARLELTIVGALFVLTGAVALVAEQIFEKLLSTVVGASTPAGAIVLAVYFAGLTAGGLAYPLVVGKLRRPLALYALLEGFVGLWALGLAVSFPWLQGLGGAVIGLAGESRVGLLALRILVAGVWILPPTVAMGMTFPAIVGVLERARVPGLHRRMALFYALNLMGAVLGAALAPYLLFPWLGLVGTLWLGAGLEVGVVLTALTLARRWARVGQPADLGSGPDWSRALAELRQPATAALVLLAAWSGFQIFGLEVVWLHLVGSVCGTSVYAFANMLLAVLLGLLAGGFIASLGRNNGERLPLSILAAVLLIGGWLLLVSLRLWDDVPLFFASLGDQVDSFAAGEAHRLGVCLALVGLPAAALGLVYPLVFRLPGFPQRHADAFAGLLAAANALGCIAGALLAGFVLIPHSGSEASLRLFTGATLGVGLTFTGVAFSAAVRKPRGRLDRPLLAVLAVLGVLGGVALDREAAWDRLALTSGTNVYFEPIHVTASSKLLFWHEDTYGGFTTVVENGADRGTPWRVMLTNGKFQGNDAGERTAQIAFALLPVLHVPARERALVIGLGTGQTAHLVAAAGFEHVEVAEIAPGIVEAACTSFGHVNGDVLDQPGVTLHLEDGRNHLLRSPERYDLVTIELTSVWFAGVTALYSREFYRLVREHLAEAGVLAQWFQLHHIGPDEVLSTMATLGSTFDHVGAWQVGGQGLLLASDEPLTLHPGTLLDLRHEPSMAEALALVEQRHGPLELFVERTRLLTPPELEVRIARALDDGVPLTTDGNRYLELYAPRHNLETHDHRAAVLAALLEGLPEHEKARRLANLADD